MNSVGGIPAVPYAPVQLEPSEEPDPVGVDCFALLDHFVEIGNWVKALEAADTISHEELKTCTILNISKELHTQEKRDEALSVAKRALDAAKAIPNQLTKSSAILEIAKHLVKMEAIDQSIDAANKAIDAADAIKRKLAKFQILHKISWVFRDISSLLADEKKFDRALDMAHAIDNADSKAFALSHISETLARANELDRALKVANEAIDSANATHPLDWVSKESALCNICKTLSDISKQSAETGAGDRATAAADLAKKTASAISTKQFGDEALSYIAEKAFHKNV